MECSSENEAPILLQPDGTKTGVNQQQEEPGQQNKRDTSRESSPDNSTDSSDKSAAQQSSSNGPLEDDLAESELQRLDNSFYLLQFGRVILRG